MFANYLFLVVGLMMFFFTHGRQLMALSPFAETTLVNTVDVSLFGVLLPIFCIGVILGRTREKSKVCPLNSVSCRGSWFMILGAMC